MEGRTSLGKMCSSGLPPLLSAPQLPWAANFALQHSLVPALFCSTTGEQQWCWAIMDRNLWNLSQNKLSFFVTGFAQQWKLTVTQILSQKKAEFHSPVPKTSTMMPLLQWCGSHGNYHAHPPAQMLARIIDTLSFITIPAPRKASWWGQDRKMPLKGGYGLQREFCIWLTYLQLILHSTKSSKM